MLVSCWRARWPEPSECRIGEASNPGPEQSSSHRSIASINVNALYPSLPLLSELPPEVCCFQEHSVPNDRLSVAQASLKGI
eukprot:14488852-Alexandrium_andersonii.AAC.1